MNVEFVTDTLMQDLRILSMIREQDKLVTTPRFGLRPPSTWRALVRRWQGENRETDLLNMRNLFGTAICIAHLNETEAYRRNTPLGATNTDRLVEAILGALVGLDTLLRTYHDDQEMCARLELLVQDVRDRVCAIRPQSSTARSGSAGPGADGTPRSTRDTQTAESAGPPPSCPPDGP